MAKWRMSFRPTTLETGTMTETMIDLDIAKILVVSAKAFPKKSLA